MKRMENLEKALRGFFVARDSDSRDESPLAPSTRKRPAKASGPKSEMAQQLIASFNHRHF
jgi:hypothetical protein